MPALDHLRTGGPETEQETAAGQRVEVIAVIAAQAGVRAGICMIAVPTLMRSVRASIQAAGVTASVL